MSPDWKHQASEALSNLLNLQNLLRLGHELGVHEHKFNFGQPYEHYYRIHSLLGAWESSNGQKANVEKLISTLRDLNLHHAAGWLHVIKA